jgi:hypothetical protein
MKLSLNQKVSLKRLAKNGYVFHTRFNGLELIYGNCIYGWSSLGYDWSSININ